MGGGPCNVLSGLGGQRADPKDGWDTWSALVIMNSVLGGVLLVLAALKMFWTQNLSNTFRLDYRRGWIQCVASAEFTLTRHKIGTPALTESADFGQWMSLCAGIGASVSWIWGVLR